MEIFHRKILKMPVAVTSYSDVVDFVTSAAQRTAGIYVCVSNVHMCMESFDRPDFRQVVTDADLVVADGRPLVWALKMLGEEEATQVRGSDLLLKVCAEAEEKKLSIGLYGGTLESLADFQAFLSKEFPHLIVCCSISPPFRPLTVDEDTEYINRINNSGTQILFVGIGCPKQEIWMADHIEKLSCVMIGVGAAFDFFSGRMKHAPRWMQQAGLEWAFRLASDPGRLWRRYLYHNPRFVWHFGKQLLRKRIAGKNNK